MDSIEDYNLARDLDLTVAREKRCELQRLNRALQAAHRSSIDIKNSYDFYILAVKEINKGNLSDAYLYCDRSNYELTNAINDAKSSVKGTKIPSLRVVSFFFKLYGLYAVAFGMISVLIFSYLLYNYSLVRILDVPLWSAFLAGLGSAAQILSGVIDDLRKEGFVVRYKRYWYTALPLLSLLFGYIDYLIFSSILSSLNTNSQSSMFATMLICFFTGFSTNWLITKLSNISRNL